MAEFSNSTYSGTESSGVILVSINLLGGTANETLYVNISTLPGSALGIVHCTVASNVHTTHTHTHTHTRTHTCTHQTNK